MKLKSIKYIAFGFLTLLFHTSCEDYLNVTPKTEVVQDDLFKTESGFVDAITGVYVALKSNNLYGRAMTITTMEHLISNWDVETGSTNEKLNYFEYEDATVAAQFKTMYAKAYNSIAQINAILAYIDQKNEEGVFATDGLYEIIKGECLTMRAYCHFDMLRIFGPVPTLDNAGTVLPYMTILTNQAVPHSTVSEFKALLFQDIEEAISLLENDPIKSYSIKTLRNGADDFNPKSEYLTYRDIRFNYYAALALKGRMHLWFGEKSSALTVCDEIISAQDPDGQPKFKLGTSSDMADLDLPLSNENLVGLYMYNLTNVSSSLFDDGVLTRKETIDFVQNQLFDGSDSDIRPANLWEVINGNLKSYCTLRKYKNGFSEDSKDLKVIPLIRLSELYLMAIECTDDIATANQLWNAFQEARNIPISDLPTDPLLKQQTIIKEYRKEFFAEGQAFYAYKRLNYAGSDILWVPATANVNYVVPLPDTELVSN